MPLILGLNRNVTVIQQLQQCVRCIAVLLSLGCCGHLTKPYIVSTFDSRLLYIYAWIRKVSAKEKEFVSY